MIWPIVVFISLCASKPLVNQPHMPTLHEAFQFPNLTWIETIAVRPNGNLLVTLFTTPELYEINPFRDSATPKLIQTFPKALGVLGLAEIEADVWAVTAGNFSSATGQVTPESFSVWRVDLSQSDVTQTSKITDLPEAVVLNGVTTSDGPGSKYILIADSLSGAVWRINLATSEYDSVLNVSATQPNATLAEGGWGINGLHTRDGYLYFTNSNKGFFRVPVKPDGTTAGKIERVGRWVAGDDFTFDKTGNVYAARGRLDKIESVTTAGRSSR